MSRSSALIVLGLLTILVPFSGLPVSIRTILLVIFGASAVGIGFSMRPAEQRATLERPAESAVEAAPLAVEAVPARPAFENDVLLQQTEQDSHPSPSSIA